MKKIDISSKKYPGTFTLVDDCDYESLNQYKWSAHTDRNGTLYAQRKVTVDGKGKLLQMHTAIMGTVKGKEIDHRSGVTLDNQRQNLRHCTHAQNIRNSGIRSNNKSGYKGVSWCKSCNKWQANIRYRSKRMYLGVFTCLIKAAKAYDAAARKYHGEFARTNFK